MTENEDLKEEIERLKKEIEELKSRNSGDERILRALQWLDIGKTTVKVCNFVLRTGKATAERAAEAGLYPPVRDSFSMVGAQNVLFVTPYWILVLLHTGKVILSR
ncbi:MAG: hypothetical protein HXS48_27780 [Theionarchaea archaeon]|nr:hypothetical protein [Theionarchaea archaeon]